jgi:hypothetical protein
MPGVKLREIFEEHRVVQGNQKLPSAAAFDTLAWLVSAVRHVVELETRFWRHSDSLRRRMADAMHELAEVLPPIQAQLRAAARFRSHETDPLNALLQAQLHYLALLATCIEALQQDHWYMVPRTDEAKSAGRWPEHANTLADAFRKAMHSTNPELELGVANSGPVVRFITAVVPYITDETPTGAAVAQHLKRARRRGRDSQN